MGSNGNTLLVSLENQDIKLYSLLTGKCLQTIKTETSSIDSLTLNHQATKAYTTCGGITNVWDLTAEASATNKLLQTIDAFPAGKINSLKISPDGTKIISNNADGVFSVINHSTGKCIEEFFSSSETIQCEQIDSNGTRALIMHGQFDGIEHLYLAPLPHERVHDATRNYNRLAPSKSKQYTELHRFIRQNMPLKAFSNSSYPFLKGRYRELCDYSDAVFLPRIKKFLELSDLAKTAKDKARYSTSAYYRFTQLPVDVQNPIYNKMSLFLQALGESEIDGKKAFHDNDVSIATKVRAIEAPLTLRTVKQAEKFLRQQSLKNQQTTRSAGPLIRSRTVSRKRTHNQLEQ
jgi:hypothetical protein